MAADKRIVRLRCRPLFEIFSTAFALHLCPGLLAMALITMAFKGLDLSTVVALGIALCVVPGVMFCVFRVAHSYELTAAESGRLRIHAVYCSNAKVEVFDGQWPPQCRQLVRGRVIKTRLVSPETANDTLLIGISQARLVSGWTEICSIRPS